MSIAVSIMEPVSTPISDVRNIELNPDFGAHGRTPSSLLASMMNSPYRSDWAHGTIHGSLFEDTALRD